MSSIPTVFAELNKLAADFRFMSDNLQVRETERNQAEEALQHAYGELETKVEQRTQELSRLNEELTAMYENLQEANRELQSEIAERKPTEEQLTIYRETPLPLHPESA